MDMFNRAFINVMLKGDARKKPFTFPIPTYNITKDFPWDSEIAELLFTFADEVGTPYFQNFINSDLDPSDIRSLCCRLRLDRRELEKNTGGLFGSGDYTGSLGVVTLNLARIGYMSRKIAYGNENFDELLNPFPELQQSIIELQQDYKNNELMIKIFYCMIDYFMDLAKESLLIKRKKVEEMLERNMMPYTNKYLPGLWNHFNTLGVNAGHECCLNMFGYGIDNPKGSLFMQNVLNHMLNKLADYQEEYSDYYKESGRGLLFNLEATPAEGAGTRFAIHDLEDFNGDIITANGNQQQYYTNSTQLPQDYGDNVFEVFNNQEPLQILYTSGTVLHVYLNEPVHNWKVIQSLVKKLFSYYKLPYISISPNLCICPIHGKLPKTYEYCPYDHTKEEIAEAKKRGAIIIEEH